MSDNNRQQETPLRVRGEGSKARRYGHALREATRSGTEGTFPFPIMPIENRRALVLLRRRKALIINGCVSLGWCRRVGRSFVFYRYGGIFGLVPAAESDVCGKCGGIPYRQNRQQGLSLKEGILMDWRNSRCWPYKLRTWAVTMQGRGLQKDQFDW